FSAAALPHALRRPEQSRRGDGVQLHVGWSGAAAGVRDYLRRMDRPRRPAGADAAAVLLPGRTGSAAALLGKAGCGTGSALSPDGAKRSTISRARAAWAFVRAARRGSAARSAAPAQ